jgi:fermentation-respiration switch protein FrsA (DUF1100 family)
MSTEQVMFPSGGLRCAGDLSVPEGSSATGPLPAVVMGHSAHMVKEALAPSAQYLLEAGFVVLAIDYRTIGSSEGQPRGQVFPDRYVEDLRNALTYLQSRPEVDSERLGLWGHSLGATVAVQVAAMDRRVKCVAGQNPSMFNGWRAMERGRGHVGVLAMLELVERDLLERYRTGRGLRMPLLGKHPDPHIVEYLELAEQAFRTFDDEVEVESLAHLLQWAPEDFLTRMAPTPLLMVSSRQDVVHDVEEVLDAYARAHEPKRLELLPHDERGLSIEPGLGESMALATEWFDEHLCRPRPLAVSPPAIEVPERGLRPEFTNAEPGTNQAHG